MNSQSDQSESVSPADEARAQALLTSLRPEVVVALRALLVGDGRDHGAPVAKWEARRDGGRHISSTAADRLEDADWLRAEYEVHSLMAIGMTLGCNEKTVARALRRHGIPTKKPGERDRAVRAVTRPTAQQTKIITLLRDWAAAHGGEPPSQDGWVFNRPADAPSDATVRHAFGTWNAALEAADLMPRSQGRRRRARMDLNQESTIVALQDWAAEHDGESPTQAEWATSRPEGALSEGAVRHAFGSWNQALRAAGLAPRKPGEYKSHYYATPAGQKPDTNRQMVEGKGFSDNRPGSVKHPGRGMRAVR